MLHKLRNNNSDMQIKEEKRNKSYLSNYIQHYLYIAANSFEMELS